MRAGATSFCVGCRRWQPAVGASAEPVGGDVIEFVDRAGRRRVGVVAVAHEQLLGVWGAARLEPPFRHGFSTPSAVGQLWVCPADRWVVPSADVVAQHGAMNTAAFVAAGDYSLVTGMSTVADVFDWLTVAYGPIRAGRTFLVGDRPFAAATDEHDGVVRAMPLTADVGRAGVVPLEHYRIQAGFGVPVAVLPDAPLITVSVDLVDRTVGTVAVSDWNEIVRSWDRRGSKSALTA